MDSEVLAVISEALRIQPSSVSLRVHLGELLLRSGEADKALVQLEQVLKRCPTHLEAISLAAQAARMAGDEEKAAAYEILVQSRLPRADDEIRIAVSLRHLDGFFEG